MDNNKRNTIAAGVLFIVATAAGITNAILLAPILGASNLLPIMAQSRDIIGYSTALNLVMAFAVIGIAVMLYPTLERINKVWASGYLVARAIEGILLIIAGLAWLMLVHWGQAYVQVGQPETGYFHSIGYLLTFSSTLLFTVAAEITFGVTAIILNYGFLRTALVPKWMSAWGLVGGVLILILGVMKILDLPVTSVEAAFTAPIALNEMILAVWLMVKGFASPQINT